MVWDGWLTFAQLKTKTMNKYKHQPQTPVVLKVESAETPMQKLYRLLGVPHVEVADNAKHIFIQHRPELSDEMNNSEKIYLVPTRMKVIRFVQDFCKAHGCNGVGDEWEVSEELILTEFDKFFTIVKR
jgi:hypothetical protein